VTMTPTAFAGLVAPAHTAVLTMELQRGIAGDLAHLPELGKAARQSGAIAAAGRLCRGARLAGVRVVHCTMEQRPDGAGYTANARLLAMWHKIRTEAGRRGIETGSPEAELLPELEQAERDIVVPRFNGLTPFMLTGLDQILRNLGVRTVVVAGVSANIGVTGLVIEAVNLGYDVVLARDAVAGVPAEYADSVIDISLSLLARLVTTAELAGAWSSDSAG
jgi:nicotinamidase-related amidase